MKKKHTAMVHKSGKLFTADDVGRYVGAVAEEFRGYVKAVAEQYRGLNKRLDHVETTLNSHTEMIGQIMSDVQEMKNDLKQKVDRTEFARLEKRVVMLERARPHS